MRHVDLGARNGPVLLFGGPYSNVQATRALFDLAAAQEIATDHMICTGDVVAYCADPVATVAAIRTSGCTVVAGNCEKQLAADADDCGCGFDAGSTCDRLSVEWYAFARARLNLESKAWMGALPDVVTFAHQGRRYGVIHGGVTDVARFIWSNSERDLFDHEWRVLEAQVGPVDGVIAGHCGIPFIHEAARGPWINAGVIGMPPHDGHQQTRAALLEGGEVSFHRLSYDAAKASQEMIEAGLSRGYADGLLSGYWPSEDILPEALRGASFARG
ncbi:diadenosine tetraphosphatase [Sulfitobacter sp. SK012]|uniref:metallophosphoesterase family protein n=1 Tax=Sulfitobacter sp. SK012 TaxID=1389005 RepID=UPI000E0BA6FD|nr:metallophosphoesterase family protein [Sulfitobacter sp. SK012]AXI46854.1 diadenosine tetraphosphatase [Sulfitobacter sp. SK012]